MFLLENFKCILIKVFKTFLTFRLIIFIVSLQTHSVFGATVNLGKDATFTRCAALLGRATNAIGRSDRFFFGPGPDGDNRWLRFRQQHNLVPSAPFGYKTQTQTIEQREGGVMKSNTYLLLVERPHPPWIHNDKEYDQWGEAYKAKYGVYPPGYLSPLRRTELSLDQIIMFGSREFSLGGQIDDRSLRDYHETLWKQVLPGEGNMQKVYKSPTFILQNDRYYPLADLLYPLGKGKRILEVGGGQIKAVRQFLERRRKKTGDDQDLPEVVNVSYNVFPQTKQDNFDGKITHITGKFFEDLSRDELGTYNIILDVAGGSTYSRRLSKLWQLELDSLEVGGHLIIAVNDVGRIVDPDGGDGKSVSAIELFKNVAGIEVDVWTHPMTHILQHPSIINIIVHKTSAHVQLRQVEFIGLETVRRRDTQQMEDRRIWQWVK